MLFTEHKTTYHKFKLSEIDITIKAYQIRFSLSRLKYLRGARGEWYDISKKGKIAIRIILKRFSTHNNNTDNATHPEKILI